MSFEYGLDAGDLEEVAQLLLGTHRPLSMAIRMAKVGLCDHDVVLKQLKDEHQIVKCSACNEWTDNSDEDPAGPICKACNDL